MRKQLLQVLTSGRVTVEYLEATRVAVEDPGHPRPGFEAQSWCRCGWCRPQENRREQVCCKQCPCVQFQTDFTDIVVNRSVLECVARRHLDWQNDPQPEIIPSNLLRKAGYRQYIAWKYNYLGPGEQRCPPSCVVWAVRGQYLSPNGQYLGFMEE